MVNPRQRRKQRSGIAKNSLSRGSRKSQRKVVVKGPAVLAESWDGQKTVRQNYASLGLLSNLNPRLSGGLEKGIKTTLPESEDDEEEEEESNSAEMTDQEPDNSKETEKMLVGYGQIIRDESGKPIRIVMPGENGQQVTETVKDIQRGGHDSDEEDDDDEETPWGPAMRDFTEAKIDHIPKTAAQGIPFNVSTAPVAAKTDVVKKLEQMSAGVEPVQRHTSMFEMDWLLSLVQKYDEDIQAMARDRKLNVWQKTPGELKKAISKAGGFSKLRLKLASQA